MKRGHYLIAALLFAVLGWQAWQQVHPMTLLIGVFAPMLSLLMLAGAFIEEE